MLHHWLALLKGFSIKWRQAFRTCLNIKERTSVKTDTKLKAQSKCGEIFSIFFPQNLALFCPKKGNIMTKYCLLNFYFSHFGP
jgi:hypothetical protein